MIGTITNFACTPIQDKIVEIKAHQQLEQYREKLADGFFETVIQQAKQVVANDATDPPADVALYALGEVYAHNDFIGKNFALSQYYFEQLTESFPNSPLTSEAKVYINLFETIAAKEKEANALKQNSAKKEKLALQKSLSRPNKRVVNQNFDEEAMKNMRILEKAGNGKPAEEALYNLGLIYAHTANPEQDYKKSQFYLNLLTEQFPDSPYIEEAQVILGLFNTIEKIQQIDIDIEKQKKQLTQ